MSTNKPGKSKQSFPWHYIPFAFFVLDKDFMLPCTEALVAEVIGVALQHVTAKLMFKAVLWCLSISLRVLRTSCSMLYCLLGSSLVSLLYFGLLLPVWSGMPNLAFVDFGGLSTWFISVVYICSSPLPLSFRGLLQVVVALGFFYYVFNCRCFWPQSDSFSCLFSTF